MNNFLVIGVTRQKIDSGTPTSKQTLNDYHHCVGKIEISFWLKEDWFGCMWKNLFSARLEWQSSFQISDCLFLDLV